jgi:hypothetical protein
MLLDLNINCRAKLSRSNSLATLMFCSLSPNRYHYFSFPILAHSYTFHGKYTVRYWSQINIAIISGPLSHHHLNPTTVDITWVYECKAYLIQYGCGYNLWQMSMTARHPWVYLTTKWSHCVKFSLNMTCTKASRVEWWVKHIENNTTYQIQDHSKWTSQMELI